MPDLDDCILAGSAIPAPFLHDGLPLPDIRPAGWDAIRRSLKGNGQRLTTSLATALGYGKPVRQSPVETREGREDAGWLLQAANGARLRVWPVEADLDATGGAYRLSPTRIAQRVLLARNERAGLLTNGETVRLLLCDPARAGSHISIPAGVWRQSPLPPDSFRVLLALAGAESLPKLPGVLDAARLYQTRVTSGLRRQTREAILGFMDALPDPLTIGPSTARAETEATALWHDCLILIYRLLFILKLESAGGGFSFASSRLWRTALSPNLALGPLVRRHLDHGADTGTMLETGLRRLFAIFRDGIACSELRIAPLGGALFGDGTIPALEHRRWGDRAVAILLDRLIWTCPQGRERARIHYGSLDVEDLGGVYEGLLELEPGIAMEPLVRLRRGRTEAVAPANGSPADIAPGQFYLRTGNLRKSTGSFYTPHEFVHFLVRETLDPHIARLSPDDDPNPERLLSCTVVDPACGSGHFLVEACRYLGDALLNACRRCDERGLHDRLTPLPDIVPYLPSRGYAEAHARAICRRMVAVHCLYGADRNKLAVDLAKVSLWLESYAEGLPLTFLDHRLIHGDALTGPFAAHLATLPVTNGPLDPLLAQGVADRLAASVEQARGLAAALKASIGRNIEDLATKQAIKRQLDATLAPLRLLARTWSGAAMLRGRDSDDIWLRLATRVADTGEFTGDSSPLLHTGRDAIPWDLTFPEVFPAGFTAVLGNPPWDVILPNTKDFVANHDPAVLDAPTKAERTVIERRILQRPDIAAALTEHNAGIERMKFVAVRLYRHQKGTSGPLDLFRLFAERSADLTGGSIGMLFPSAFHANDGAAGIRRLYSRDFSIRWLLSFENRRRIFDIDSRFKFDTVVAHRPGPATAIRAGFYLTRIEDAADPAKIMTYTADFLHRTGGTPLELRGTNDLAVAETLFANPGRLGAWCERHRIRFGCDLHMTADSGLFHPAGRADVPLHEGKTFHQYTIERDTTPRYSVQRADLPDRLAETIQHPRLVFRDIARSNDERTMIATIAPPGVVFGHTATVEKAPDGRDVTDALALCAVFNSFTFDWLVRLKTATHLSLYLLQAIPMPRLDDDAKRYLARAARTLLGHQPRSPAIMAGPGRDGWSDRAHADAFIARAYGLTRDQYQHILSGFSHKSDPDAPARCLKAFDHPATPEPGRPADPARSDRQPNRDTAPCRRIGSARPHHRPTRTGIPAATAPTRREIHAPRETPPPP